MNRMGIVIAFALLSICALAVAQQPPAPVAAPAAAGPVQTFVLDKTDISSAVNTIGRLYGVKVLAQEDLRGSVTANVRNATVETALTIVSAPNGLLWRQFTLTVKPTDSVTPKTLAGLMDALDAIQYAGIVMKGPQGVSTVMVERDPSKVMPSAGIASTDGSKATTYYYLYSPKTKPDAKLADAKTPVSPTGTPATPAAPATATPALATLSTDNQAAVTQISQWLTGLDQDTRQQVMRSLMRQMMGDPNDPNNPNLQRRRNRGGGRGGGGG